ncbi:MAG: diaminopimelate decarboxylase [Monoglobales bacterium]
MKKEILHSNVTIGENSHLYFAGVDTVELAKKYGTPLILIDENRIRERCREYVTAMKQSFGGESMPLFASKALSFKEIYRIVGSENMGCVIVSPGELYTAKSAGFPMEKAYFHGNNKTDEDIAFAMDSGLGFFVVDGVEELESIDIEAGKRGIKQKILLRLTPGIDPHTHKKISTGGVDSKFGSAIATGDAEKIVKLALDKKNIRVCGYHCHVGSQIFEIDPFVLAADIMLNFSAQMRDKFGFEAEKINLGGGFGIRYIESDPIISITENIEEIAKIIKAKFLELNLKIPDILMEPGRSIVADSGMTIYTVGSVKEIEGFRNYVSIDGGMTDNPRYALYQSNYTFVTANKADETPDFECTIGGRCCESGDLLGEGVKIAKPKRGDNLAVLVTGAYNYSMASNYNRITKPPIVIIKDKTPRIAVKRQTFEDLTSLDL